MSKKIFYFLLGGILLIMSANANALPKLIPRDILFGNPVKASPRISPDGKRMAYLAPVKNVLNVWVKTIGKDDDKPVTKDTNRGIRRYFWAEDNIHIMYLQDLGGNENWRLYWVDLQTGDIKDLTPYNDVQVQIVDQDKHFPNELLIAMNKENPKVHDVYRLDLKTGNLELVAKNPGNIADWVTDTKLKVRGSLIATEDGGYDFMIRADDTSEWKKVVTWGPEDNLVSGPVGFSKDGKYVYMKDSRDYNTGRLVKMDIATGKLDVIAEDSTYDVSGIMINPDTYDIEAVSFYRARDEWTALSENVKKDFEAIKKLHDGDFSVVSQDDKNDTWLVGYTEDTGPVSYYVYDRKTKTGTFLFYNQPDLAKYTLAPIEPISFTSRDGLTIHGYITFPPGKEHKNLPMVLNVHGGPWARDDWGYNPEAQWLANRGYICLEVNYRGSTGYGKNFVNAGDHEWAGKMHNDLVDAVQWAIQKGYANPKKVAIYGGSYGGYAALVGATFTPDLFCCAVDIVGPSNLITLIKSIPPYWSTFLANFQKRVGNPDTEADFLKSRSPLFKVDNVKIPMLIAQGANDPRVKQAEAEQIVDAMKKKGIQYEYMLFPDEGHGFAKPENRIKFYTHAEKFLADHLGGRYEK